MKYALVAVDTPFLNSKVVYSYKEEDLSLQRGSFVEAPLGTRKIRGVILKSELSQEEIENIDYDLKKIKSLSQKLEKLPLDEKLLKFYSWVADYYKYPVGKLIFEILPKDLKRPRKLSLVQSESIEQLPLLHEYQKVVFETIEKKLDLGFSKSLIHGVTGSGKSLIYLKVIEKIIAQKKSVLFMLPEINLTVQFIKMFSDYLEVPIYTYNSSISNSDKWGLWNELLNQSSPCLIIGVRSSVFLPFQKLGLIIVDEEHDSSFKQDDRCAYNGKDIAIKRAHLLKIPIILGSATPTVENYYNFKKSKSYYPMIQRANDSVLPEIIFKNNSKVMPELYPFHPDSLEEIKSALEKKEQILVFVNKLGYSNYLLCGQCGHQYFCKNCSIPTRFFKKKNVLSCFNCDYEEVKPSICSECGNMNLSPKGFGTEKLEEILKTHFTDARIKRFDRDEIKTTNELNKRLEEFHHHEIDILVGTQMLSKGHNFSKVNLVLVLGTDGGLNQPDFRANEKVFQLLTQISGRSGRYNKKGKVILHTAIEDHEIYKYVKDHSFNDFYESEVAVRQQGMTPPFNKLALIYLTHKFEQTVIDESIKSASFFEDVRKHFPSIEVWGPRPAIIEKRVNKFTWTILLKSGDINELHNSIASFNDFAVKGIKSSSIKVDIDPYSIS